MVKSIVCPLRNYIFLKLKSWVKKLKLRLMTLSLVESQLLFASFSSKRKTHKLISILWSLQILGGNCILQRSRWNWRINLPQYPWRFLYVLTCLQLTKRFKRWPKFWSQISSLFILSMHWLTYSNPFYQSQFLEWCLTMLVVNLLLVSQILREW